MQPEAVQRLLKALGLATMAAIIGGIGTALAFKAVDDGNIVFGFFAALLLGLALLAVLFAIIAAGGKSQS